MEEKKGLGIAVKVLTIAFAIALVAFVIFFSIQLYRSTIFDLFDEVYITENLNNAYKNNDDIRTHSVGTEGLSENGVIKVTELVYIEALNSSGEKTGYGYMQFGVRINKLHIEEVQASCSSFDYDDISFYLVGKDENDTKCYEEKLTLLLDEGEKYQYKFYKFEVNDAKLNSSSLSLEMRLNGVVLGEDENGDSALLEGDGFHIADSSQIHTKDRKSIEYDFSRKEKKKLEEINK